MTTTISQFLHHQFKIQNIFITSDSKRVLSIDVSGISRYRDSHVNYSIDSILLNAKFIILFFINSYFRLWQADSGVVLLSFCKQTPCIQLQMIDNMLFQIAGKNNNR